MVCSTFMVLVSALFWLIRSLIVSRTSILAENLALRQQMAILNRKIHRPQLHRRDRFFWVILSRLWKNWREVLITVKPNVINRLLKTRSIMQERLGAEREVQCLLKIGILARDKPECESKKSSPLPTRLGKILTRRE